MNKFAQFFLALAIVFCVSSPLMAQPATGAAEVGTAAAKAPYTLIEFSRYFGAAFVTIGAAFGIGKLASSAYESMSRQPEVAGNIQTAMIIAAALIEGFTFFALFICFNK